MSVLRVRVRGACARAGGCVYVRACMCVQVCTCVHVVHACRYTSSYIYSLDVNLSRFNALDFFFARLCLETSKMFCNGCPFTEYIFWSERRPILWNSSMKLCVSSRDLRPTSSCITQLNGHLGSTSASRSGWPLPCLRFTRGIATAFSSKVLLWGTVNLRVRTLGLVRDRHSQAHTGLGPKLRARSWLAAPG